MTKPTIGFIGLGLMGGNMVECLQKNGFQPIVISLRARLQLDHSRDFLPNVTVHIVSPALLHLIVARIGDAKNITGKQMGFFK